MRVVRMLALVCLALAGVAWATVEADGGDGVRTVHVRLRYSEFSPGAFTFAPGETVRFVVENADPIDHEFLVGDLSVQIAHERGTEAFHPPRPGEISVPAGATRVTTYTFGSAGPLILGCHLPGHYAYGMRAPITVA